VIVTDEEYIRRREKSPERYVREIERKDKRGRIGE
jgi:hypothetical protein